MIYLYGSKSVHKEHELLYRPLLYPRHTKYKGIYGFRCCRNNVCLSVCVFFFEDFLGIIALKILKFGTNIGYDFLYGVRENQHPHAYHSHCPFSLTFTPIKFFVKDFAGTTAPRILKFVQTLAMTCIM